MVSRIAVSFSLAWISILGVTAYGQTVALPQPVAVVKDGDGKVVAQVAGVTLYGSFSVSGTPLVILNIDGIPACFRMDYKGLRECYFSKVYFSEPNCIGSAYVSPPEQPGIEQLTHVKVVILGPDPILGTYRVFRSVSFAGTVEYESYQEGSGQCTNLVATWGVSNAIEVLPNPLEGFHGPSLANPDRTWTIEGGDRIQ